MSARWLEENGFPLRGIVSGCGSPTERLSGSVDYHLQDGMKGLDSFLRDTKDTLKVIEELNDKIDEGELSLEGVALVSLDIVNMYNNMSEELGTEATKEFLCQEILENRFPGQSLPRDSNSKEGPASD